MPEFLLEVGCEELPASFVEKAYTDLAASLSKELEALGILNSTEEPKKMGTPRRLIVSFPDLKVRQEDSTKEQRGPSLSAAYGADGAPTGALMGFCKSQGITVADLRKDDQYVWLTKQIPGRDTVDVLASLLPEVILGLSFEKSMRWGSSKTRFARPIRWILASFDEAVVPFMVEDVPSALLSQGHRFYAPAPFEAKNLSELTVKLRNAFVEPVMEMRKEKILKHTIAVAKGTPEISDDLLDENTFLCEWPTAISGSFPESYLELPEPVLVTAMAKHERMFPVRDSAGKLTNSFVFIRNSGEDETVRRGCEWVLGARFNDARFFYEQDQKLTLDDFLAKTEQMLFQAQLGTVRQRADRLSRLAGKIALETGASRLESDIVSQAALYAKADLCSGLVGELSSLQGLVGAEYAQRQGFSSEAVKAIANQYLMPVWSSTERHEETSDRLVMADQLDKLAGYLGIGIAPTGSSDPFGLRRAVTILIRIAEWWNGDMPPYSDLISFAFEEYRLQGFQLDEEKALEALAAIFIGRYTTKYSQVSDLSPDDEAANEPDIANAAILSYDIRELTQPKRFEVRRRLMSQAKRFHPKLIQTATRPLNLLASVRSKGISFGDLNSVDPANLQSETGDALFETLKGQIPTLDLNFLQYILTLIDPVNSFFDDTMILVEDEALRYQRLSLVNAVAQRFLIAGDFTKLEG